METIEVLVGGIDDDAAGELMITSSGGGSATVTDLSDGVVTLTAAQMAMLNDGALTASIVSTDNAENSANASTNSFSLDTTLPLLSSAVFSDVDGNDSVISDADTEAGETVTLTLTFSEAMDQSATATAAITIGLNTTDLTEVGSRAWSTDGTELIITYTVADNEADLGDIIVDVSGAQDVAGNILTAVTDVGSGTSIDTLNPLDETYSTISDENADGLPATTGLANDDVLDTFNTDDGCLLYPSDAADE